MVEVSCRSLSPFKILTRFQPDFARVCTELHQQGGRVDVIYPRNLDEPEVEEMVLRTQGFVVYTQLPPIVKQSQ